MASEDELDGRAEPEVRECMKPPDRLLRRKPAEAAAAL
jgi:hypothetical protein